MTTTPPPTPTPKMQKPDSAGEPPLCVSRMLARLEQAAGDLAKGKSNGPYLLEALLDDVDLCPSLATDADAAVATTTSHDTTLARRVAEARDAARLVIQCPEVSRTFALERLNIAIASARNALDAKVAEADANGAREALFGPRCATCTFA
ncbi:MAG: hypothetical protein KDJ37_05665 [Hyphomicrobiaceae bacterium]|nr:hypothetical protein [Hyphomicrobiaceae bacterium]